MLAEVKTSNIHRITVKNLFLKENLGKNSISFWNNCSYEAVWLILQTWELKLIILKSDCLMLPQTPPWNHKGSYPASSILKKSQAPMWKSHAFLDLSRWSLPKICSTQPFHSTLRVLSPLLAVLLMFLQPFSNFQEFIILLWLHFLCPACPYGLLNSFSSSEHPQAEISMDGNPAFCDNNF